MATMLLSTCVQAATSVVLSGHTSWVNAIAVSRDGKLVATGGNDGAIGIWGIDGRRRHLIHLPHLATPMGDDSLVAHLGVPVNAVAFDPTGRWLAAGGGDGVVHLVAVGEGRITATLSSQATGQVNALCWLPDGRLLAGGLDGCLTLWDVAGRRVVTRRMLFQFPIQQIALAPDGKRIAVCAMESRVKIATLPGLETAQVLKGHKDVVYSVAWSSGGRYLASGSNDRRVLLWDLQEGASHVLWQDDEPVYAVAFAPDGATVAIAPRGTAIDLLTVPEGETVDHLTGHTADICALCFPAPDLLVSSSRDATARIWHLNSSRQ